MGSYLADLWVADRVIVEIKAVQSLSKAHEVQPVNYLTATGVDTGLLLNFGSSVEVKGKFRTHEPVSGDQTQWARIDRIYNTLTALDILPIL